MVSNCFVWLLLYTHNFVLIKETWKKYKENLKQFFSIQVLGISKWTNQGITMSNANVVIPRIQTFGGKSDV